MKNSVSIIDFGAIPNSKELQTEKIQAAIDHCFLNGGGEVIIPQGEFLTGGIRIRSNITLHLLNNSILKGSDNPEDYFGYLNDKIEPLDKELITNSCWSRAEISDNKEIAYNFFKIAGSRWNNALIKAVNAENFSIIGEEGSLIDGNDVFDELGEEHYRGPHTINLFYCRNVTLKGYTIQNGANWANTFFWSENITADNITVLAGHDGIHFHHCNNISIKNCKLYTCDDCIGGFSNTNVTVKDCELNSACSGLRFGGTNVVVENCHIYGPCKYHFKGRVYAIAKKNGQEPPIEKLRNNMLSAFTYYSDFSTPIEMQPGNIIIRNCRIDYADRFIHYNYSGNEIWQTHRPLESVTFENIKATDISMPLTIYGDKNVPIKFTMKNVEISMRKGFEDSDFIHAAHHDILLKNVKIDNYKGKSLIKTWSEGKVEFKNLNCSIENDNLIEKATEKFICQPI